MKKQALNPYLPFWETVPDGEPHLFGDRVYIYGSHDELGGNTFCPGDYVCWSAPADDLGDWRYEGVIYKKAQDPINGAPYGKAMPPYADPFGGTQTDLLYAPDVTQGPDGRYYLYYSLDFTNIISVAVCDTPAGEYQFLDYVACADGSLPGSDRWYDPGVLCEDGKVYLYYGFCPTFPLPGMPPAEFAGGMVVQLAPDMHTIISQPKCVAPSVFTCQGTGYQAHPFFEAASIRHYDDWYYLVYSSLHGHELCYGMSRSPLGPFDYKGILHSNADLGLNGNTLPTNYFGNNHGGLVKIGQEYYVFGHRHTHGTSYSRQGIAEKITMNPDGTFNQAELTSCGLNGGPLPAAGEYSAHIACHLTGPDRTKVDKTAMANWVTGEITLPEDMPYITEETCPTGDHGLRPFIHNMQAGAICGFKYFDFGPGGKTLTLQLRGKGTVGLAAAAGGEILAQADFASADWQPVLLDAASLKGVCPLYLQITAGTGDLLKLRFE